MTAERSLPTDSPLSPAIGPDAEAAPSRWWAVQVDGDLDLATGPGLDTRLRRLAAEHPGDGIVLDLSTVDFMDCAGLRPLLRARARLGRRFCLRAPSPRVLRFLVIAEVVDSLRILPAPDAWPAEAEPLRCVPMTD